MKKAMFAALAFAAFAFLISCGEDEPDPDPEPNHQQIIDEVNARLDALGFVLNADNSAAMVVSFNFKTADTAENRALLKVLAPNAPTDGRLIVRSEQTLEEFTAGVEPPLEVGNMKLEVASETSVAMNVEFIGTVTIDENDVPIGINTENTGSETYTIKYPLSAGGLEIDGAWYAAVEAEETP